MIFLASLVKYLMLHRFLLIVSRISEWFTKNSKISERTKVLIFLLWLIATYGSREREARKSVAVSYSLFISNYSSLALLNYIDSAITKYYRTQDPLVVVFLWKSIYFNDSKVAMSIAKLLAKLKFTSYIQYFVTNVP